MHSAWTFNPILQMVVAGYTFAITESYSRAARPMTPEAFAFRASSTPCTLRPALKLSRIGGAMEIEEDSLDDILASLYPRVLSSSDKNAATRGGTREIVGMLLHLRKPRARLSRSYSRGHPFSALGELLWYLARSDRLDFIRRYIGSTKMSLTTVSPFTAPMDRGYSQ